jgi:branched-chain amino acid transport system substrate-binding protein
MELAVKLRWILAVCVLVACDSVVPPDDQFQSAHPWASRCKSVGAQAGPQTLTLAAAIPLTKNGKPDARGTFRSQAMQLALEEINQRYGVSGRRFRLRLCDTKSDWSSGGEEAARGLATWLTDGEHVAAMMTGGSSDTLAAQSVTVAKSALLMSITGTSTDLTNLPDEGLVWRVAPSDQFQGLVLAQMASETMAGAPDARVAVIAVQNPYGDGLAKVLKDALGAGLSVHSFAADGAQIPDAVAAAAKVAPSVLIVAAPAAQAAKVVNLRATQQGLSKSAILLTDSAHNADFLKALDPPAAANGARGTQPGTATGSAFDTFRSRYQSRFGVDPSQQSYTAHAYDAVYCLALVHAWALRKGGPGKVDGPALADGLRQLAQGTPHGLEPSEFQAMQAALLAGESIDISGASGPLDFDPKTGEAPSPVELWKVDDKGQFASQAFYEVKAKAGGGFVVVPATK